MSIRINTSPSFEFSEKDNSNITILSNDKVFYVMGYAEKSEPYFPKYIYSIQDFIKEFGNPTNEAEKYFYYSCKNIIDGGGTVLAARLPYDNVMEDNYKYYQLVVRNESSSDTVTQPFVAGSESGQTFEFSGMFDTIAVYENIYPRWIWWTGSIIDYAHITHYDEDGVIVNYRWFGQHGTFGEGGYVDTFPQRPEDETILYGNFPNRNQITLWEASLSSEWLPTLSGPNYTDTWWDLTDDTYYSESGGKINGIVDKTGNGNTGNNSTEFRGYSGRTINGLSVCDFRGDIENNYYNGGGNTFFDGVTIAILYEQDDTVTSGAVVGIINGSDNSMFSMATDNTLIYANSSTSGIINGSIPPSTGIHIRVATKSAGGNTQEDWIDGELNINDNQNTGNNIFVQQVIGNAINGNYRPFNGTIGEVIVYPTSITTEFRQQLEGYLAHKWGVTANLPLGHPYKDAAPSILPTDKDVVSWSAIVKTGNVGTNYFYQLEHVISGYIDVPPTWVQNITNESYDQIKTNTIGDSQNLPNYVLYNNHKAKKSGKFEDEGLFAIAVTMDDAVAVQRLSTYDEDYIFDIVTYGELSASEFVRPLTGTLEEDSVSYDFVSKYPPITTYTEQLPWTQSEIVTLVVAETKRNKNKNGALDINILETHTGSVNLNSVADGNIGTIKHKQNLYIGDVINRDSKYLSFYQTNSDTTITADEFSSELIPRSIQLLGFSKSEAEKYINIDNMSSDMEICLSKVSNINDYKIDYVLDAGLSTIRSFYYTTNYYDPKNQNLFNGFPSSTEYIKWQNIIDILNNFCSKTRKDCVLLGDLPRYISVEGNYSIIRKTNSKTVALDILPKLENFSNINSTYTSLYITWLKIKDEFSNSEIWLPPSSFVGYIASKTRYPWDALAGPNNGILGSNVLDISFNPNKFESDIIIKRNINYIKSYKGLEYDVETQLTTAKGNTFFNELYVRTLCNYIKRNTENIVKRFIYEGNNIETRSLITNQVTELMKIIKLKNGLYDFQVICDETNNTSQVIDNNEIRLTVAFKPNGITKFVLVDVIGVNSGDNFSDFL